MTSKKTDPVEKSESPKQKVESFAGDVTGDLKEPFSWPFEIVSSSAVQFSS